MLTLKNNPILTKYQIEILKAFFSSPLGQQFFLTGGTALAAFYLGHRLSKDLDLFTLEDFDSLLLEKTIEEVAQTMDATVTTRVKTPTYNEIYLQNAKENWTQRIDLVKDQPVVFGERREIDVITVDSLVNIASGKILAMYGRLEPKDYIDIYFLCKERHIDFFEIFKKTKKKDLGLDEFHFANIILDVETLKDFPKTIKPFDQKDLVRFFLNLSNDLFEAIKPKE